MQKEGKLDVLQKIINDAKLQTVKEFEDAVQKEYDAAISVEKDPNILKMAMITRNKIINQNILD